LGDTTVKQTKKVTTRLVVKHALSGKAGGGRARNGDGDALAMSHEQHYNK